MAKKNMPKGKKSSGKSFKSFIGYAGKKK